MQPQQPHDYRTPPPGTAAARDMVCAKCGAKRSTAGLSECPGNTDGMAAPTQSEYEPFEGNSS